MRVIWSDMLTDRMKWDWQGVKPGVAVTHEQSKRIEALNTEELVGTTYKVRIIIQNYIVCGVLRWHFDMPHRVILMSRFIIFIFIFIIMLAVLSASKSTMIFPHFLFNIFCLIELVAPFHRPILIMVCHTLLTVSHRNVGSYFLRIVRMI